ncbi:MAG: sugar ABC transporter permease [Lachnospiraceae bacterium]|nr:sugar ABC transporter permease [Lachnospiraceae bacterium]
MDSKKKSGMNPGTKLFLVALPFFVMYFLFSYLPVRGWIYSFYDYKPGLPLDKTEFVGLENFVKMFINPINRREFLQVMENTLIFAVAGIATSFLPMFFAILLNELPFAWLKKLVQTCTTIPHFIGWVLVYALAFSMFSSQGFVSQIMMQLGIWDQGKNLMSMQTLPRVQMWLYGNWKGIGWSSIIYLASLGSIDQELYEAAEVDGAGRFAKIRFITIPGLLPTFITLLIMSIGNFLSVGMEQYMVFSNAFNTDYITVLDLYVYNEGLLGQEISYSTAIGIYKSIIGLILLCIANWFSGKVREEKIF